MTPQQVLSCPLTPDDLAELQSAMAQVDASQASAPGSCSRLLWRRGHVKLQMYSELAGHKRPHFHIAYKRQYAASYAIDTLDRLCGYLPSRYEECALGWARDHQASMRDIWNSLSTGNPHWTLELPDDDE